MDVLSNLQKFVAGTDQAVLLAPFLFFLLLFLFAYLIVRRGAPISLRPIAGYTAIKNLLSQSAETGQPVHLSLGISGIGDRQTTDTAAGLNVLEYVADQCALTASPPIVTMANPTTLPVAQDVIRHAYARQGNPGEYDPARARFIAPDPSAYTTSRNDAFAYAAGVMQLLSKHKLIANIMIGQFGDEFLLMGEVGARQNLTQVGGTSSPNVLPFVNATMTHPLIGEEIYAGGAYLSKKPSHLSSLLAQDLMRWVLVLGVIAAIVLKTMGLLK